MTPPPPPKSPQECAAEQMDWQQVVLNGGPPCFHIEDGFVGWTFCGRAKRWAGHGQEDCHDYISLEQLLKQIVQSERDRADSIAQDVFLFRERAEAAEQSLATLREEALKKLENLESAASELHDALVGQGSAGSVCETRLESADNAVLDALCEARDFRDKWKVKE